MRYLTATLVVMACCTAEVIDRMAVAVENSVITESEIVRHIRLVAFLNREKPVITPESKRDTAERLIEQILIRREIALTRYVGENSARAEQMYKQFRARFKSEHEYQQSLAEYGLRDDEVRAMHQWQATLLAFIETRFHPGIQIPEEEIRAYYDQQIAPKSKMSFDDVRGDIEYILTQQRVDNELDRWLGQVRTQTRIRYRQEVFR